MSCSAPFFGEVEWELGAYIDDVWSPAGGEAVDVVEPATGEPLGCFRSATPGTVREACAAASAAQPAWGDLGGAERGRSLGRVADALEARRGVAVDALIRESGSAQAKAAGELTDAVAELRWAAAQAELPPDRVLSEEGAPRLSRARRVPLGVVGAITPWNVPLLLAMRTVAPALALGNTVVLKPDPNTPVSGGAVLAAAFEASGLPSGIFSVILGGAETGEALVADPATAMISFTGSTAVGRRIGELAGGRLKKVALELGGNSPLIVLDDADVEAASSAGAWGSFQHQGQVCMASSRHLVHESVAAEYVERLAERAERLRVGDPAVDPAVELGPLINGRQLERVEEIVEGTISAGARLCAGGTHRGLFYRPTVLAGVTTWMPGFRLEIFGPVAPVTTFADDDEAVALAADTEYGLAAAIHSRSAERAVAVGSRIPAGMLHVNDQTVNDAAEAPFGGRGSSGNGSRFGGDANWEAFSQWQWTTVRETAREFPF